MDAADRRRLHARAPWRASNAVGRRPGYATTRSACRPSFQRARRTDRLRHAPDRAGDRSPPSTWRRREGPRSFSLITLSCDRQASSGAHRWSWGPGSSEPVLPFRRSRERSASLDRLFFARGDDAEEAAVAHHCHHARHRLRRRLVEAFERRAVSRRAHDAAVQHAGQAQILNVGRTARHLARECRSAAPGCRRSCAAPAASAWLSPVASRLRSASAASSP